MSLIQNAIDSIEVGVEDYEKNEPRRAASAIRNFAAGVLLLLKEKLRLESPPNSNEALIYSRVEFKRTPSGVVFVGKGQEHGRRRADQGTLQEPWSLAGRCTARTTSSDSQ